MLVHAYQCTSHGRLTFLFTVNSVCFAIRMFIKDVTTLHFFLHKVPYTFLCMGIINCSVGFVKNRSWQFHVVMMLEQRKLNGVFSGVSNLNLLNHTLKIIKDYVTISHWIRHSFIHINTNLSGHNPIIWEVRTLL